MAQSFTDRFILLLVNVLSNAKHTLFLHKNVKNIIKAYQFNFVKYHYKDATVINILRIVLVINL